MSHEELIEIIDNLPLEQQVEVFDFAAFLASRCLPTGYCTEVARPAKTLDEWLANPLKVNADFAAMKRDDLYDRACLH